MSFVAIGGAVAGAAVSGMFADDGESSSSKQEAVNITEEETTRKYLDISDEAIDKIVGDILGSETGIADIFSKENVAGLYNSTVAAQASGDLIANLTGEIAKLRATQIEETDTVKKSLTQTEFEQDIDTLFDIEGAAGGLNLFKDIFSLGGGSLPAGSVNSAPAVITPP